MDRAFERHLLDKAEKQVSLMTTEERVQTGFPIMWWKEEGRSQRARERSGVKVVILCMHIFYC